MEYAIRARGLTKHYDGFALDGVDLTVETGTVVGFIGANGAGKTTTIKAILGLIPTDGGTVELLGEPTSTGTAETDAIKRRIGVVFDTCSFPSTYRIGDVGTVGKSAYPTWDDAHFASLCTQFGLPERKQVKDLSRGMGMKLTLAFALAHDPELLILDEATAGLDPLAREEVLDILRAYMEQPDHAVLMSSHITSDLEKIADEIVCIDEGRIMFDLAKDTITDEAGIAHLRAAEVDGVLGSGIIPAGDALLMRNDFSTDLLVPDRFAFAAAYPEIPVDRATIESYMTLKLKGESR